MPAPLVGSSPGGPRSTAVAASRARTVAGGDAAPISSRTSASQPAVCGAAAEVPKNRQSPGTTDGQVPDPKPPTPLTEVPSAPRKSSPWNCCGAGPATPTHGPGALPGHTVVSSKSTGPPLLNPSSAPLPPNTAPIENASPV